MKLIQHVVMLLLLLLLLAPAALLAPGCMCDEDCTIYKA
jgi:hypothetical protein